MQNIEDKTYREIIDWFDYWTDRTSTAMDRLRGEGNQAYESYYWAFEELNRLYNYAIVLQTHEEPFNTLSEMISTSSYQGWIGGKLGNDLFINDPDRAKRIYDAAEDGWDGSTHAEVLDDMQEYLDDMMETYDLDEGDPEDLLCLGNGGTILKPTYDKISKEIENCRLLHEKSGTLYEQVG